MRFHPNEIALLSNTQLFDQKNSATDKLKKLMESIRELYLKTIVSKELLAPASTDFKKGQIARGENYEGYPYVILDFPKHFSQTSIFTYRTMFWFGHYLYFSVILAGDYLPIYRTKFKTHFENFTDTLFYFGIHDVWNWKVSSQLIINETNRERIISLSESQPYIKLLQRFSPDILSDENRLLMLSQKFYESTLPITTK